MSSWLWLRTCCRISAVPFSVGGTGSGGEESSVGILFDMSPWY